jgi:hypothetical protein
MADHPPEAPAPAAPLRVAIIQSGYLPWKGYFDIIHDVDLFIFLDNVQFTSRDWRNRNRIKTLQGLAWLTVPVGNRRELAIDQVPIQDTRWQRDHWSSLRHHYARAPHFRRHQGFFEDLYLGRAWGSLAELNTFIIRHLAQECLGLNTPFMDARAFSSAGGRMGRLLDILQQAGAGQYVSGPSTRGYLDVAELNRAGIAVTFKNYDGYPEYRQFFPPFCHQVSVLDLLFHTGPDAPWYIWGWRDSPGRSHP